jgi:N-acetylmuramoyl-L-alanine amidase
VPAVIIETGFLTNARDRLFLTRQTDLVAAGIANGILQFLSLSDRVPL